MRPITKQSILSLPYFSDFIQLPSIIARIDILVNQRSLLRA